MAKLIEAIIPLRQHAEMNESQDLASSAETLHTLIAQHLQEVGASVKPGDRLRLVLERDVALDADGDDEDGEGESQPTCTIGKLRKLAEAIDILRYSLEQMDTSLEDVQESIYDACPQLDLEDNGPDHSESD